MQKNLGKKGGGRSGGARKHATTSKKRSQNQTKKGALAKPVKRPSLKVQAAENGKITKRINAQNEGTFAGVAQNAGGTVGEAVCLWCLCLRLHRH
jgi:hypothetical protein